MLWTSWWDGVALTCKYRDDSIDKLKLDRPACGFSNTLNENPIAMP
jgi:hypothetical protein